MKTTNAINLYQSRFYKKAFIQRLIEKGLIAYIRCKSFIYMVGGTGFEPATSTV